MKDLESFETLVKIMDRLREPDGCPWDREQDYESLRSYLIEECYEVADALDRDDRGALREELGDLLFQIVFLSRLAKEEGNFVAADVVRGIAEKMVRRHPHVFGDETVADAAAQTEAWERLKAEERQAGTQDGSLLAGIARGLPPLVRAAKLGRRAAGAWRARLRAPGRGSARPRRAPAASSRGAAARRAASPASAWPSNPDRATARPARTALPRPRAAR